jgi:hypothetical protein
MIHNRSIRDRGAIELPNLAFGSSVHLCTFPRRYDLSLELAPG